MTSTDAAIVEDMHIMGGVPVFKGTRVPIAIVLASLRAGSSLEELREAYPFLTQGIIEAAQRYVPCRSAESGRFGSAWPKRVLVSRNRISLPPQRPKR